MSDFIRTAHGAAAAGGAELVVETPPIDEVRPLNAGDTAKGLAIRAARGRPFQIGNRAAADRGPSLTRVGSTPTASDEQRRVERKAATLKSKRKRELDVQHGGPVSSAVEVELVAWARATAWSDHFYRVGDATGGAKLAEKASGHGMKAIAIASREAGERPENPNTLPPGFEWVNQAPASDAEEGSV